MAFHLLRTTVDRKRRDGRGTKLWKLGRTVDMYGGAGVGGGKTGGCEGVAGGELAVKLWQEEEGEMLTEDKFEQEELQTR